MAKCSIRDIDLSGKRVLLRVDFNVPLKEEGDSWVITDDTRIRAALPTIEHLIRQGARLIIGSHLGRPDGKPNPKYSLSPVAARLGELIDAKVSFVEDCVGKPVRNAAASLKDGEILLLENLRFHPGEESNDTNFAAQLAEDAEFYVNDAFGTAHRAHASTDGAPRAIGKTAIGFLMEKELDYLDEKLANPPRPFVVIMGGAKVSDKIEVITNLLDKADTFLIGGAMAYTFLLAQGRDIGKSLVERDKTDLALEILRKAEEKGVRFVLPADSRFAKEFRDDAPTMVTARWDAGGFIPDDMEGIDIGDEAILEFSEIIASAGTVIWNGPLGVFEKRGFDVGTRAIGEAIANSGALKIVGGGDSVTAVNKFGLADRMDHNSTGGGASLELLEGKQLPGVLAIADRPD
jgi:3-phosphoglycerate kinase